MNALKSITRLFAGASVWDGPLATPKTGYSYAKQALSESCSSGSRADLFAGLDEVKGVAGGVVDVMGIQLYSLLA